MVSERRETKSMNRKWENTEKLSERRERQGRNRTWLRRGKQKLGTNRGEIRNS